MSVIESQLLNCRARQLLRVDCNTAGQFLQSQVPALSVVDDLISTLRRLLRERRIRGGIIEVEHLPGQWQVAALGLSGFVTDETRDDILSATTGGFARRFLLENNRELIDEKTQALYANAGLNLVVIAFVLDKFNISQQYLNLILARSLEHFIATHRGFHIKSLLREDPEDFLPFVLQTGLKQLGRFLHFDGHPKMHLLGFLPQDRLTSIPGGVTDMLIHFGSPRLGCSIAECRVLDLASAGLTDGQIAVELEISPNTLKKNWRSILERSTKILDRESDHTKSQATKRQRGPELRSRILFHLRDNPQDMRPWDLKTK